MTADVDLLPLPDEVMDEMENMIGIAREAGFTVRAFYHAIRDYARAVAEYNVAQRDAEIEALRAEVREAREFRDKMANAIGSDQLRRFIEKHGEPVPLTIRMQEAEAEVEALRAEVERLRAIAGCAYQMAGVHDAPEVWLDRLSQAANGDALPDPDTISDELLPYQPGEVCEAEARAERLAKERREFAKPEMAIGLYTENRND